MVAVGQSLGGLRLANDSGLVNLKPNASFVIVSASGGYTTNLTLSDFLQTDVLFAINHDGVPLSAGHGGPIRLVVPRLYFRKSAKWVTGMISPLKINPATGRRGATTIMATLVRRKILYRPKDIIWVGKWVSVVRPLLEGSYIYSDAKTQLYQRMGKNEG